MNGSFAEFLTYALSNTGRLEINFSPQLMALQMRYYDGGKVAGVSLDAYAIKRTKDPDWVIAEAISDMRSKVEQAKKGERP